MKKILQVTFSFSLLIFSFYYTNLVASIIRNNNPIMLEIKNNKAKYESSYVNAIINDDTIIPGIKGKNVNLEKSFQNMMKYGSYNDSLYVFDEIEATLSIDDNFNKYINRGRADSNKVSLVYTVNRDEDIMDILTVLSDNDTTATFFIDGLFLENNRGLILNMLEMGHEVEIYNYNGNYREIYFKSAVDKLNELRENSGLYCYSDYKKTSILNLCKKLSMHTVIPTINIKFNLYKKVKDNLEGGIIIKMPNGIEEVGTTINYIKQRGYKIANLSELLSE